MLLANSIASTWNYLVPAYKSRSYPGLIIRFDWDVSYSQAIERISEKRSLNRCANYLDKAELTRAANKWSRKGEASIRFGVSKPGHGYNGERGDFCLVGGVIRGKHLTLLYRSLELIGGLAYDLCLISMLSSYTSIPLKTVTILATKANVFALKGNSNEKLFPKLQEIFRET